MYSDLIKAMRQGADFRFWSPLRFFEKSDAPEGRRRRFAGISTTDAEDQQGERVLQDGLDFSPFLKAGWFNDNHGRTTGDVVGFPTDVRFFRKGDTLPDGTPAHTNLHWSEGFLLEGHAPADRIWSVGKALSKSGAGRELGQSIEGKILRRAGAGGKTIAKAVVRNVAITHVPVNADTSLSFLAKSLATADVANVHDLDADLDSDLDKVLSVGADASPAATQGPKTGEGAGRILTPQSIESECYPTMTKAEQFGLILQRYPGISCADAGRLLDVALIINQRKAAA